ncbi:hypothetical protein DPX16_20250 [Anabarilius grahami]|uniref:Uncharacterized protein n=1 Tax=Anabarilius grahami TaxID=495550 RepID=A0A3N0XE93_ANAGA|nr:hypothetical protein DPX16_20250 [Anabarilius grahami]
MNDATEAPSPSSSAKVIQSLCLASTVFLKPPSSSLGGSALLLRFALVKGSVSSTTSLQNLDSTLTLQPIGSYRSPDLPQCSTPLALPGSSFPLVPQLSSASLTLPQSAKPNSSISVTRTCSSAVALQVYGVNLGPRLHLGLHLSHFHICWSVSWLHPGSSSIFSAMDLRPGSWSSSGSSLCHLLPGYSLYLLLNEVSLCQPLQDLILLRLLIHLQNFLPPSSVRCIAMQNLVCGVTCILRGQGRSGDDPGQWVKVLTESIMKYRRHQQQDGAHERPINSLPHLLPPSPSQSTKFSSPSTCFQ